MHRTVIEREQKQFIKIGFAVHLSAVISAERYRSDSGALKSAVLTLVYFYIIMIVHKCQQSAKRKLLLNKNNLLEVFPLTIGSGKTMTFENRRGKDQEIGKKVPQAYRVYVEDTFLPCDAVIARIFVNVELDEETGLYYYGARYLDPKYSRWLSTDPALNDYMAGSSVGEGGIYNTVNLNVYHYGGNNPIRYTDPTGKFFIIDDLIGAMIQCTVDDKWSEFENRVKSNFTNSWSLLFNMVNTFKDVNNIRDFVQGIGELIGRFTWGILGICVGFLAGYVGIQGFGGQVSNYKNLTMVQTEGLYGAFIIGFVSVGDKTSLGDKVSQAHEYGHYLISLLSGPFYIVHALASLVHASIYGPSDNGYFEFWTERDADILGGVHVEWKDGKIINRRMKK